MKVASLRVVKVAETRFVLDGSGGTPWEVWQTDTENDAQKLVEFAGRLCYESWQKPNPATRDNVSYVGHIIDSLHFSVLEHAGFSVAITGISRACCYDADTEVLTSEGWKRWPDVVGTEWFATLNPLSNTLEYQQAGKVFVGDYDGPMYQVQSEQVDLLVTPNHRMWVQKVDVQAYKRGEEPFRVYPALDIVGKRVRYQKGGLWIGENPERVTLPAVERTFARKDSLRTVTREYGPVSFPARTFARFLGYYLAEGYSGHGMIQITQRAGPVRDRILKAIGEMGLYAVKSSDLDFRVRCAPLYDFLLGLGRAPMKTVPGFVQEWGADLIREFLDAVIDGDGSRHRANGHEVIYTTSKAMADALQILCIKAGYSANIRVDDRVGAIRTIASRGKQVSIRNNHPCYIVSIVRGSRLYPHVNHNRRAPHPNRWRKEDGDNDGYIHYKGTIHCVEVANGLLFVRRNGKPIVSGNSHELVRHRHFSFSQLSQRFFDETDAAAVVPSLYSNDPDAQKVLEEVHHFTMEAYKRLVEIGTRKLATMKDKTHRRKRVREAARAVLPNMTEVHIVVSGNHRAWREFFEKRGDIHAEPEIREVAVTIFKEVAQPLAPAVYQDMQVEEVTLDTGEVWEAIRRRHPTPAHSDTST